MVSDILMIRPVNFAYNEQTAPSNTFQNKSEQENIQEKALEEFDQFVQLLKDNGVNVIVINDTPSPHTPDSIFPNNWISFHEDGTIFLFPMQAENRRLERKPGIIDLISQKFLVKTIQDLSHFENENLFLEGTGSMVLDRENKVAYACISPRTDIIVLNEFCNKTGYKAVHFHSRDINGVAIYHTNVMMCIGSGFAVICMDSISDQNEKEQVQQSLEASNREIIKITPEQLNKFAGNMIYLTNKNDDSLIAMSDAAFNCLEHHQKSCLQRYGKLLHSPLNMIENIGGGSARCMIAEIYLPKV